MWDLVGNPEERFSHNEAHNMYSFLGLEERMGLGLPTLYDLYSFYIRNL